MGTWGAGNFDNDTSADHLSIIAAKIHGDLKTAMEGDPVELEPDEYWGNAVPCNVEILALFAEQRWVGNVLPDSRTVAAWKKKYLAVWDKTIDTLGPDASWKKKRRAIIVKTFDRLAKQVHREETYVPPKPKPKPKKR
jgi:hypothetical protein